MTASEDVPVPDYSRLLKQEDRRWTAIGVLGCLLALSVGLNAFLAVEVDGAVESLRGTARDTNRSVTLLEQRTPLFGEMQATEERIECVSSLNAAVLDALAEGLVAVVAEDEQALSVAAGRVAETRARLSLLGTDRDPCR